MCETTMTTGSGLPRVSLPEPPRDRPPAPGREVGEREEPEREEPVELRVARPAAQEREVSGEHLLLAAGCGPGERRARSAGEPAGDGLEHRRERLAGSGPGVLQREIEE